MDKITGDDLLKLAKGESIEFHRSGIVELEATEHAKNLLRRIDEPTHDKEEKS